MELAATKRLYLHDSYCFEAEATVIAVSDSSLAVDQTCFYPGGGGQPPDCGSAVLPGDVAIEVTSVAADEDGVLWHASASPLSDGLVGQRVRLSLDAVRRLALMRYHTALHTLNTIVLREYEGWITGVQIGAEHSRIDFRLPRFSAAMCAELERKVNAVISENRTVRAYYISANEFQSRPDLLRTLVAQPPVSNGEVRVVEIEGFEAQACGGTHVRSTSEVGRFSILRVENKGRINKRLYVHLEP